MKYSSQVTSKREEPPNPPITEVDNYTHVSFASHFYKGILLKVALNTITLTL
jgi:hypothetical protein